MVGGLSVRGMLGGLSFLTRSDITYTKKQERRDTA